MAFKFWRGLLQTRRGRKLIILPPSGCGFRMKKQILLLVNRVKWCEMDSWCKTRKQTGDREKCCVPPKCNQAMTFSVCTFIGWLYLYDFIVLPFMVSKSILIFSDYAGSSNHTKQITDLSLFFFVLTTHMFVAFHWKEARLIACTSLLARNIRRMKCEVSVGVRGCVRWCAWANVMLPVPDIPATL